MRWQKEAASLRDLFGRAGFNCKVGTDNSFNEAKLRSQDLSGPDSRQHARSSQRQRDFTWPEIANRPPLMKRMERSLRERLGPWTSGKGDFTKNRDAIIHEAECLLVLARVIKSEGYEYADDARIASTSMLSNNNARRSSTATKKGDLQKHKARLVR